MQTQRPNRDNERGISLISTAVVLTALFALTAVGVDIGRIAFTATEAQNSADIAATGGAMNMLDPRDATGTAQSGATVVLNQNQVDGNNAVPYLTSLEVGNYDGTTFSSGGTPANAVRATVTATVNNIFAGMSIFGTPQSTVQRVATASFVSLGAGTPSLPIAIGADNFQGDCYDDSCLPQLIQVPSTTDNTAWTGFFGGASTSSIGDFFPTDCGGGGETVGVAVGDYINLNNGQETPLLNMVDCLVNTLGINQFLVPVVDSSGYTGSAEVKGFVTVVIDEVTTTGNPKGMTLHAIFSSTEPGPPGPPGGNFGTGSVALVG